MEKMDDEKVWDLLLAGSRAETPEMFVPNTLRAIRLESDKPRSDAPVFAIFLRWIFPAAAAACVAYFCAAAAIAEYRTEREEQFYMVFAEAMDFDNLVMPESNEWNEWL